MKAYIEIDLKNVFKTDCPETELNMIFEKVSYNIIWGKLNNTAIFDTKEKEIGTLTIRGD